MFYMWACTAANGNGSLVFIGELTAGESSRVNSEEQGTRLSAQTRPNASKLIGPHYTVQPDNDPMPILKTQDFFKQRNGTLPAMAKSDLNPIEHAVLGTFCLKNKQELKKTAVNAWQNNPAAGDVYGFETATDCKRCENEQF